MRNVCLKWILKYSHNLHTFMIRLIGSLKERNRTGSNIVLYIVRCSFLKKLNLLQKRYIVQFIQFSLWLDMPVEITNKYYIFYHHYCRIFERHHCFMKCTQAESILSLLHSFYIKHYLVFCAVVQQRRLGLSTKNPSRFLYHVYKHYIGISNTASFYCLHISNKSFIVHEVYAPVISTASFDTACDWTWTNVSALKRVEKL